MTNNVNVMIIENKPGVHNGLEQLVHKTLPEAKEFFETNNMQHTRNGFFGLTDKIYFPSFFSLLATL